MQNSPLKKGKLYVKGRAEDQAMIRDLLAGKSVFA